MKYNLYKITEQGRQEIAEWYKEMTGKNASDSMISALATMGGYELSFGKPPVIVIDLGRTKSGNSEEYVLSPEAYEEAGSFEWPETVQNMH
jgi:hypothetical protein